MSQEILASIVGRTVDWLSKVENNRIDMDRLSVIKALADALDVSLGDLLAEPSLADWTPDGGHRTVPALRDALRDARQITPFGGHTGRTNAPSLAVLGQQVSDLWQAYQASRFGYCPACSSAPRPRPRHTSATS